MNITETLCRLGVTAVYHGFFYASYAAKLAKEDPENLLLVTKRLYPAVAERYGTTPACVERSIRWASEVAWKRNPGFLTELARHDLKRRPTGAEFIAILAFHGAD